MTDGTDLPLPLSRVLAEEWAALGGDAVDETPPRYSDQANRDELADLYARIHAAARKTGTGRRLRTAICLSGGGIRSATFNLGLLQGLAAAKLMDRFDYVSTVSGGGYIGSWLGAWIHRAGAKAKVFDALARSADIRQGDHEPQQIRHLRDYSQYLSPRLGILSADTWTLVATYFRNLCLLWLALVPLILAALGLPRLAASGMHALDVGNGVAGTNGWTTAFASGGFLLVLWTFGYAARHQPSTHRDGARQENDTQSRFLLLCWLPVLVGATLIVAAWYPDRAHPASVWEYLGTSALLGVAAFAASALVRGDWSWWGFFAALGATLGGGATLFAATHVGSQVLHWLAASEAPPGLAEGLCATFAMPTVLLALSVAGTLHVGIQSRSQRTSDEDREWWARFGGWVTIAMCGWLLMCALVLLAPGGLLELEGAVQSVAGVLAAIVGGGAGLVNVLLGRRVEEPTAGADPTQPWRQTVLKASGPLFLAFAAAALSLATSLAIDGKLTSHPPEGENAHFHTLIGIDFHWILVGIAVAVAIGLVVSWFVDLNKFSLHWTYRNRLIRAYLGASNPDRHANPFTGFDPEDNVSMHELFLSRAEIDALRKQIESDTESEGGASANAAERRIQVDSRKRTAINARQVAATRGDRAPADRRPLHLVNIALNLVAGKKLAWQKRKADSFTISALHCGNASLGYRRAGDYGGPRGISLGTALSLSGAAVSPNMGAQSTSVTTFLMTLFNVRLGGWLGNPGQAGKATFDKSSPRWGVGTTISEAFGRTDSEHPWVYLSDGGHFENLGVYEMIRRRCHVIVVSDAGYDPDPSFEDLGNLVRKVRVDLGVPINFTIDPPEPVRGVLKDGTRRYHGVASIDYAAVDGPRAQPGVLIYIKSGMRLIEPSDVDAYARENPCFPNDPTSDQFFDESQFESYRALGRHIADRTASAIQDAFAEPGKARKQAARSPSAK